MSRIRQTKVIGVISILVITSILLPLNLILNQSITSQPIFRPDIPHSSGETTYNQEWLNNNDFSTQDDWVYTKGSQGDNSTLDANISGDQANYIVVGEENDFQEEAGAVNASAWYGWDVYSNGDFLLPDTAEINSAGCYVYHYLDEGAPGGQLRNFPSVHFKKNISLPNDMSDYEITMANLEVIFNASVNANVDVSGDSVPQSSQFDSATFYVDIADLDLSYAFRVADNKTTNLGQDSPPVWNITDTELTYVSEDDLITALNLALEKDPSHSDFTIILGIDIYCEDNEFPDLDMWNHLIFKSFNLTFDYQRKVDQFSSISWSQIGNTISGSNIISSANLKFKYKIDNDWPTSSPFSEIRMLINNNQYGETIKLSSANSTLQDAKPGGFDVTNLILKDVNITLELQVFIANTFELNQNLTISIDDVYLNITYIETFADFGSESQLFLNTQNKTLDPFIQIPLGESLNITIKYLDNETGNHLDGANVRLSGKISKDLSEYPAFEQYSTTIDTSNLGIGIWSLTVTAEKSNYEIQTIPFFVDVVKRPTSIDLYVNDILKTDIDPVKIKYNDPMNITVFYEDNLTNQHLINANVSITNFGVISETNEQYTMIINSNSLNLGFNVLTITAQIENYTSQTIQLYVEVYDRATEFKLLVDDIEKFENDLIQIQINEILNLTVYYRDNVSKNHLSSALITLIGIGNFTDLNNQYNYTLDSNDLSLGFNVLTIYAQFDNYETHTIQIYVEVYNKASEFEVLVDSSTVISSEIIRVNINEYVNLTAFYRNNETKLHLPSANVSLIGWGDFSEIGTQYNYTIDTNDLSLGITVLSIVAQLSDYQSQNIQFYIELIEKESEVELFINSNQQFDADTIQVDINQMLNLTIFYHDNESKQLLTGATVSLVGFGDFSELATQYNYSLNSMDLGLGFNVILITAQINNYKTQIIQIFIEVNALESELLLYIDGDLKNARDTIEVEVNEFINVTVFYQNIITKQHLGGATVSLTGFGGFSEVGSQFNFTINTNDLAQGVTILSINAQLTNYLSQNIEFYAKVIERETELEVYVDSIQRIEAETLIVEVNQVLNITAFYRDNITKQYLSTATITLQGIGNFSETGTQFNYTLSAVVLDQGITILTVFAHLDNFQPQTFQFYIKVIERASQVQLFLNMEDKTNDPVVELPISSTLNITVRYTDNQTDSHIVGGIVQLTADSFSENFTESIILGQYSLILDTSTLKVGVNLFTILIYANNFQFKTINLRITINKISTLINTTTGETYFSRVTGDDLLLSVVLNDLDFGGNIFDASVTYRWAYGNGTLVDDDHDGVYETELVNVPTGTYTITITASAGDDYSFYTYEITLNVVSESLPDFTWLFITLAGAFVLLVAGFTLYQARFKYPPMVRKVRKLKKKISKEKKLKPITLTNRDDLINARLEKFTTDIETSPVENNIKKKKEEV